MDAKKFIQDQCYQMKPGQRITFDRRFLFIELPDGTYIKIGGLWMPRDTFCSARLCTNIARHVHLFEDFKTGLKIYAYSCEKHYGLVVQQLTECLNDKEGGDDKK